MAIIPVYCPHCGHIFTSRAFSFQADVIDLRLEGNTETCPQCKKQANIVDGTFNVTADVLSMISGPEITESMLRRFGLLADEALTKQMTRAALEKQAGEISPALGEMVKSIDPKSPSWLLVLALIVLFLKSCDFKIGVDAKVDVNRLYDQIAGSQTAASPAAAPKAATSDSGAPILKIDPASKSSKPN